MYYYYIILYLATVKMATMIVSEVVCFVSTHFGHVPNNSIQSIIANFYNEDDLVKARLLLHDVRVA